MSGIERRLARLEQAVSPPRETVHVWAGADAGETADQVIARLWPEGLPEAAALVIYHWADADQ